MSSKNFKSKEKKQELKQITHFSVFLGPSIAIIGVVVLKMLIKTFKTTIQLYQFEETLVIHGVPKKEKIIGS